MDLNFIPGNIRKRGCSSSASSSSSSVLNNYRFKRAILVGKRGGSSTPVSTWKLVSSRSPLWAMESPKGGSDKAKQGSVSARRLAATLWEMNEVPSPSVKESYDNDDRRLKKESLHYGSLPPHLHDPSLSPVSERMDRSGTDCCHRRTSSISNRLRFADHHVGPLDPPSNASLMVVSNTEVHMVLEN